MPCVCVALVLLGVARAAHGQGAEKLSLRWHALGACEKPPALDGELARTLAELPSSPPPTRIDVYVREQADGFTLTLALTQGPHRADRTVQLANCLELQRAASLLIASALAPAPAEPASTSAAVTSERRLALRAGVLADLQALPAATAAPTLGTMLAVGPLRLSLEARYLFARSFGDRQRSLTSEVDALTAALGVGYAFSRAGLRFGPQAELELGALRARVVGARAAGQVFAPWGAALLGGFAGLAFGRFELLLSAWFGLPLWRPLLVLEGELARHRTSAFTLRGQLALQIALGSKKATGAGQ